MRAGAPARRLRERARADDPRLAEVRLLVAGIARNFDAGAP